MKYQGGKSRLAKRIASEINGYRPSVYVEPFVGAGSVLAQVDAPVRLASDSCSLIISLMLALQDGWVPPTRVGEDSYKLAKNFGKTDDPLTAFIAYGCSWGGKRWGGYARGDGRNFADEAARSLEKMRPSIQSAWFKHADYREISIPSGALVYCDPPYAGTLGYRDEFDHEEFWGWADEVSTHSVVLVSEINAPDNWESVLDFEHVPGYEKTGKVRKESVWKMSRLK